MTIKYAHHEGSQPKKPKAIDATSSKTAVYARKNIKQVERKDPASDETVKFWEYDEAMLSPDEYPVFLAEDNAAKVEYIAMMSDIDLEDA